MNRAVRRSLYVASTAVSLPFGNLARSAWSASEATVLLIEEKDA
jgi:hypothetical protein